MGLLLHHRDSVKTERALIGPKSGHRWRGQALSQRGASQHFNNLHRADRIQIARNPQCERLLRDFRTVVPSDPSAVFDSGRFLRRHVSPRCGEPRQGHVCTLPPYGSLRPDRRTPRDSAGERGDPCSGANMELTLVIHSLHDSFMTSPTRPARFSADAAARTYLDSSTACVSLCRPIRCGCL